VKWFVSPTIFPAKEAEIMVAQGCASLKTNSLEPLAGVGTEELRQMQHLLLQAANDGTAAHVVERDLFRKLLELGHSLFGAFLAAVGPGDVGESAQLDDGRIVHRLPEPHARPLRTVFGEFELSRCVYGSRERQKIELIPTDQRLQLPESELSYLLQEWDQLLGIEHAFGRAREVIEQILRLKQSVDTLEQTNQHMAEAAPVFRAAQPAPDPQQEGSILVATEDNKGIPMVRAVAEQPAEAHRKKGEKANKKQMACIGCVYSVDPLLRTPEELVQILFRDEDRPKYQPVRAQQKRYWAELSRVVDGVEIRGQDRVFQAMKHEIAQRRQPGQVLVHLSDGQASLETDRQTYLPRDEHTVDVLDLMHAIPRLWQAAHVFHAEGSDEAEAFVRQRLLRVLQGKAAGVVRGLRQMATKHGSTGTARKSLRAICDYLEKNLHRMKYDEYLSAGYPIASGVIEGACRHVIKDRMERAGMRWKVPGAQAMLQLRTIQANGDWERFQDFRIEQETSRLYPNQKAPREASWPCYAQAA
jgi:hypothetical protein